MIKFDPILKYPLRFNKKIKNKERESFLVCNFYGYGLEKNNKKNTFRCSFKNIDLNNICLVKTIIKYVFTCKLNYKQISMNKK